MNLHYFLVVEWQMSYKIPSDIIIHIFTTHLDIIISKDIPDPIVYKQFILMWLYEKSLKVIFVESTLRSRFFHLFCKTHEFFFVKFLTIFCHYNQDINQRL